MYKIKIAVRKEFFFKKIGFKPRLKRFLIERMLSRKLFWTLGAETEKGLSFVRLQNSKVTRIQTYSREQPESSGQRELGF